MRTNFDTLVQMSAYIINCLTEEQLIEFLMDKRLEFIDSLATELAVSFATDEDIREQAIEEVEERLGEGVIEGDITETEVYNHARKEIIKSFNGEAISGLYLVESINQVAHRITQFMLNSEYVDDVFSSDEDMIDFLVPCVRAFSARRG